MSELVEKKQEVAQVVELDNRGFEGVDISEIQLPTAKLIQPTSPELMDDELVEHNIKMGDIRHSLTHEKLEAFVPIKFYDDKMMFVPKNDQEKKDMQERVKQLKGVELTQDDMDSLFICRAQDNRNGTRFGSCKDCPFSKFDGNKKPLCNKNVNVLGVFEGNPLPTNIRFTSTSYKHGNVFKMLAMTLGTIFKRRYKLFSTKKQQDGNTWFELKAKPAGLADPEIADFAESMYTMYKDKAADVDEGVDKPSEVKVEEPKPSEVKVEEPKPSEVKEETLLKEETLEF